MIGDLYWNINDYEDPKLINAIGKEYVLENIRLADYYYYLRESTAYMQYALNKHISKVVQMR